MNTSPKSSRGGTEEDARICGACGRRFKPNPKLANQACAVVHAPGDCCHYGEIELTLSNSTPLGRASEEDAIDLMKGLGCVWSEENGAWLYGHGAGWTSQVEPELVAAIQSLLAEARKDELETARRIYARTYPATKEILLKDLDYRIGQLAALGGKSDAQGGLDEQSPEQMPVATMSVTHTCFFQFRNPRGEKICACGAKE